MFDFFRSYLSSTGSPSPLYVEYVSVYWFKVLFAITRFIGSKYTKLFKVTRVTLSITTCKTFLLRVIKLLYLIGTQCDKSTYTNKFLVIIILREKFYKQITDHSIQYPLRY